MKLEDLKALAGKKTKGPWKVQYGATEKNTVCYNLWTYRVCTSGEDASTNNHADMRFIAMAENNIDALIAVCEAAKIFINTEVPRPQEYQALVDSLQALESGAE